MNELQNKAQRVFSRFSPFIRNYIYQSGWSELRNVQIKAAEILFEKDTHLLISSDTASGKTEAAFFPILSMMQEEGADSFQVLYLSPLKSLINDQYSRMEALLKESALPVFRWHGDVSRSHKNAFIKHPCGVLQITPESLEGMLCTRRSDISRLFGNLKFVIIDEVHALMNSDRGSQILCQLQRMSRLIGYDPRRVALSATIGDPEKALEWLNGGSQRGFNLVQISNEHKKMKIALSHFYQEESEHLPEEMTEAIYNATANDSCIVFSNSREETETVTAELRQLAKRKGDTDRFYIHHGNLSASIRHDAEIALKDSQKPITACATATLELGIDIGVLKRIVNIGSPYSVSGFLQRLGRSGRKNDIAEMLLTFHEDQLLPTAEIGPSIPWEMIQAIAIIELYRDEHWIEPPIQKAKPMSLVFHQTLSVLCGKHSCKPAELAREVLSLSPFRSVSKEEYKLLLSDMIRKNYLQLTDEKELIIGLAGERLIHQFHFYAVFRDREEFTVRCGAEEIGTLASVPPVGERFALAGRVWKTEEIDSSRRLIYAVPVEGILKASWPGTGSEIHTRILRKMKNVLCESQSYPYLMQSAQERLNRARDSAKKLDLSRNLLLSTGPCQFVLFPWLGTGSFETLKRILKYQLSASLKLTDIQSSGSYYITFRCEHFCEESFWRELENAIFKTEFSPDHLIAKNEYPTTDKYDPCLPRELLVTSYFENRLQTDELQEWLNSAH